MCSMIKALSQKMDKKNFECFITNYETLIKLKENKTLWASAMSFVKNEVFTKNIFDSIGNPYNYIGFTNAIKGNQKVFYTVMGLYNETPNSEPIRLCLEYFYTTQTYIGFIVELLLYDELSQHTKQIYKNNVLDFEKKADILICGNYLQIKNITFLYSHNLQNNIEYYKSANDRLHFIFYTIEKDNIYFVSIGGNCKNHISSLNGFTLTKDRELIPLRDFAEMLIESI